VTIIGIAGESGTGKSTLAGLLVERRGGVHVDTDRLGHELLESDDAVIAAVRERIGEDVFDKDGRVERRRLGEMVFGNAALLAALNAIVHPAIRRRCGEIVTASRAAGEPLVVIDGALLLDSKMPFAFDLLIALRCEAEVRLSRIMAKGGWTEDEIRNRLANQGAIEKSFYKAGAVVDTDGELEAVYVEIDRLVDAVVE